MQTPFVVEISIEFSNEKKASPPLPCENADAPMVDERSEPLKRHVTASPLVRFQDPEEKDTEEKDTEEEDVTEEDDTEEEHQKIPPPPALSRHNSQAVSFDAPMLPPALSRHKSQDVSSVNEPMPSVEMPPDNNASIQSLFKHEGYFGIAKVTYAATSLTKSPQFVIIKNDNSGSMSQPGPDGLSKQKHSNHATSNILRLLAELSDDHGAEIWVQVDTFDDKIDRIVQAQRISKDNVISMCDRVDNIRPRNNTDIGLALSHSKSEIAKFLEAHEGQGFQVTQILTTDGVQSAGEMKVENLVKILDSSYQNIFVGMGLQHSADTLTALSGVPNGSYYYMDDIEGCGIIYGLVVHGIFYRLATEIRIVPVGALIYDFNKNAWVTELRRDAVAAEATKVYHLLSESPFEVELKVFGVVDKEEVTAEGLCMPPLMTPSGHLVSSQDNVRKYMIRHCVLELLYEVAMTNPGGSTTGLRQRLEQMNTFMVDYMAAEDGRDADEHLRSYHNDVMIALKTLGTSYQKMYAVARGFSNAEESPYKVTKLPSSFVAPTAVSGASWSGSSSSAPFGRSYAMAGGRWCSDPVYTSAPAEGFELRAESQAGGRSMSSATQRNLMRQCSAGTRAATLFEDEVVEEEEDEVEEEAEA
jgi:hypothetical protein